MSIRLDILGTCTPFIPRPAIGQKLMQMIETTHLFPILPKKLIELLKSLSPEDWNKKTIAKLWTVKDIAANLLDGDTG